MSRISHQADLLVRDLLRLLADLAALHGELAMHMKNKLEAFRRADAGEIQSITARETTLAERLAEREGLRRQITARLIKALEIEPALEPAKAASGAARPKVRLAELAEQLPEPRRSQLLVAAAGLRDKVAQIELLRSRTQMIAGEMLKHLGEVLKVMRAGVGSGLYSRSGRPQGTGSAAVFEAVG